MKIYELLDVKTVRDVVRLIVIVFALIGGLVGGCAAINKQLGLKDDHEVEERLEAAIEDYSGLPLDLSPDSPESESES